MNIIKKDVSNFRLNSNHSNESIDSDTNPMIENSQEIILEKKKCKKSNK